MRRHQTTVLSNDANAPVANRASLWLTMAVHWDAARLAPRAWAVALWWRVLGKRVRARAQFAPLFSASSHAYGLWLLKEPALPIRSTRNLPPIVVLIAAGNGQDETLRSLVGQDAVVLALGTPGLLTLADAVRQIDWTEKPWLLPLAAGDLLAPKGVAAYRAAAGAADCDLADGVADHRGAPARVIYADDDLIDGRGRRVAPHFKPAWNAELFCHHDYLTGASIVRASQGELAGLAGEDWPAQLVAQLVAESGAIRLPHVLHHRRSRPEPQIPKAHPPAAAGAEMSPQVSVIVPTRNRVELLRTCLEGLARTDYPDLEIIVVDNGSDDPATLAYLDGLDPARHQVLRHPGPFNFSTLNNRAAELATGDLLCLLNNDIEVLEPDWLEIMVRQALRAEVGAVGAQLLYPDGRIQHAGVVMGICGGAAHAHRLLQPGEEGYFRRHALPQFASAVTAACLVVQRDKFMAVGGLDEQHLAVAFNDVDLCMRLNEAGWQSLYEPRARLVHHESVSRGLDRDPVGAARLAGELAVLKQRWNTGADPETEIDPWHHPQLNRFSERFVVRL